jgi:hypothetical protein
MPDPIWLDSNIVIRALNGDPAINRQLSAFRKAGRQLLIPPTVARETLYGNVLTMKANKPVSAQSVSPELQAARRIGMDKLAIKVDMEAAKVPRSRLNGYYDIPAKQGVSASDRLVLGQIKAGAEARRVAKPQMVTAEKVTKPMRTQADKWGIEAVPAEEPTPGSVPEYPRIDLAKYPEDNGGPISRWFKDRPVLTKAGLIGANIAAQYISQKALAEVMDHFSSALQDAKKEFNEKYPAPGTLKSNANLDRYKRAYDGALSKLNMATNLRAQEAVILAFTRDRDIDRVKKYLDDQISKVLSANDGSISGYSKIAQEYIDQLTALYKQSASRLVSADIAADIDKRGQVIRSAGDALEVTYYKVWPIVGAFPLASYIWLDVLNVANALKELGGKVMTFGSEIHSRHDAYVSLLDQLGQELQRVSDDLYKYAH